MQIVTRNNQKTNNVQGVPEASLIKEKLIFQVTFCDNKKSATSSDRDRVQTYIYNIPAEEKWLYGDWQR